MSEGRGSVGQVSLISRTALCARMLRIAWQIRRWSVIGFFVGAALEISGFLASIYATARLGALLAAFITTGETSYIWFWLWIDVAMAAITAIGFFIMSYTKRLIYFSFVHWSTNIFLSTLCRLDIADYYDQDIRNQINKVSSSYTWQVSNLSDALLDLLYGILRFLAITIVVAQITWWLIPVIVLFLLPTLFAESRLAKIQWFVWGAKGDQRHIFWGIDWLMRQAKSQMEIRGSQVTRYLLRKIDWLNKDFYAEQERKFKHANKVIVPTKILEVAGVAIGSIVLLRQFLSRSIALDKYLFLSGGLLRIGGALNNIFATLSRMQEPLLFVNDYFSLVDSKPKLVDRPDAEVLTDNKVPDIEIKNLSFHYPGHSTPVFKNLNLHIAPGEHVALVGENGAGKSTLIKLLLRLYRPTKGQILINGVDLNDISIESWYALLATLFQDFNQYPLPIGENVWIGRPDKKPDHKLLNKAGEFSGINSMVKNYKHRWNTVLDSSFKKGVEPSGGQWQRVALARAFYRQSQVLVLDEPTAAIDAKAEYDIFNSIFEHYQNKTTIIVSHRFSTVRRANRIIVLEKGEVIESGSHKQLMKRHGLYHEMFTKQAEGYR